MKVVKDACEAQQQCGDVSREACVGNALLNGGLTVAMSRAFVINENGPCLITLARIPMSAPFPIVISSVLCVKYNECVHLGVHLRAACDAAQ